MPASSRRIGIGNAAFWSTLGAVATVVGLVGAASRVVAPQLWLLLLGLPLLAAHGVRWLLLRALAPLSELQLSAARLQEVPGSVPQLDAHRFGALGPVAASLHAMGAELLPPARPSQVEQLQLKRAASDAHDAFLRSVSHELRTPLNAILGFSEVLLSELEGPVDAEQRENLTIIRDSGKRLLWLVNDVIDLAASAAPELRPARELIDITALLDELREVLEERRGLHLVYLRVEVAANAEQLVAERSSLLRTLRVLAQYMLAATESGELLLAAKRADGDLLLSVGSDAAAVDVAAVNALLSEQAVARPTERATGLRLAIAQRLAALLSGHIEAQALAAGGAVLVLRVPAGPST